VLFGLSLVTFAFVHLLPGDPARAILGQNATPEAIASIRQALQLDRPLWEQYFGYLASLAHGDLGVSVITGSSVASDFAARFPATVELAFTSLVIAFALGVPLGRFSADHRGSLADLVVTVVSLGGISIPIFVSGLTLQYVFGAQLGLLPTAGRLDARISVDARTHFVLIDALLAGRLDVLWDGVRHMALPALALASIPFAVFARITRAAVVEASREDHVRVARSKGLSERTVRSRHIMRNAWLPVVTVVGLEVGSLLAGAVITETVFAWPGVGSWVVAAIHNRDYFIVQSSVLIFALIFLVANLAVDVAYAYLDPRIRFA
jgi:peptide/nickel transport system permease protein